MLHKVVNNALVKIVMSLSLIIGTLFVGIQSAQAAKDPVYTGWLSSKAIGGFDPVAYFTEHQPVKGNNDFTIEYMGADWYFSSADNLIAFKADPEKYAPQYGGYCAWAVSQGYTAKGDPYQWTVHNDKLYLNYDLSVQRKWLSNKNTYIQQANDNWPKVIN